MSILTGKARRPGSLPKSNPLARLPGLVNLIYQRRIYHIGLTLLALFGVILAVGLVTSASFFSEAVDRAILLQELENFTDVTNRPPFSTGIYIFPSSRNPVPLEQAERLSRQIENIFTSNVGLPARQMGMLLTSGGMMLRPAEGSTTFGDENIIGNGRIVYVEGVGEHLNILDGKPLDEKESSTDMLDVWVHEKVSQAMNLRPGETLGVSQTLSEAMLPLRVAGVWKSADPTNSFWFSDPNSTLGDAFLVRRDDYIRFVQSRLPSGSREVNWYLILDENAVVPQRSPTYISGFDQALKDVNVYLPGARLNSAPLEPLKKFVKRSATLTVILLAYNLPAFGILLYFLMITSTIMAQWQRRETAILASRGMNTLGIFNLTLFEQAMLFLIGFPLGVGFGMLVARMMSYTSSFMNFAFRDPLTVTLYGLNGPLIILALAFSLISRLVPAMQASRHTVVTEEREWSRPIGVPFWYKYYLDLLLIIPTWYAYDQMSKRGSLAGLIVTGSEDLLSDPLLILVPALFVLVAALLTMRVFALVMRLIDAVAGQTPWVTLHLALRQLGRQSQDYIRPLLLVIIALAIGVYTISMAASLDQWLIDRFSYNSGADLVFTPQPVDTRTVITDGNWIPPTNDYLALPGVVKATRVGDYPGRITPAGGSEQRGRLLVIDRADFPQVAWWRKDFASESLGAMMNRLALSPDAVLVSNTFLEDNNLALGDKVSVLASLDTAISIRSNFIIVGAYEYFPTAYEETSGYTVVANLDYITDQLGYTPMHSIWLKLAPGTKGEDVLDAVQPTLAIDYYKELDTRQRISSEQAKLEQVGVFGTLTVGFLATAVMAVMGLLIYSYASLRERVYRFAVLNALGLLRQQIIQQVITEYAFLSIFGAAAGAWIGITVSRMVVPFFRYTGERGIPLPPIVPIIAEDQVILLSIFFAVIILVAEVLTIMTVFRQQLARLIKSINQ